MCSVNGTILLAAFLLLIGGGLVLYYFPYALFPVVGWRPRLAIVDLCVDEHTQDDNPKLVYEIRVIETTDPSGATKLRSVYPLPPDNVFRTRDAAEQAIQQVRQTSAMKFLYSHPCFPWVAFLLPVFSSRSRRAMVVRFFLAVFVAFAAVVELLFGFLG